MIDDRFDLELGKWVALQTLVIDHPLHPYSTIHFMPFCPMSISPRKTGYHMLCVKGLTIHSLPDPATGKTADLNVVERELKILRRREMLVGEEGHFLYIFIPISWEWIRRFCPDLCEDTAFPHAKDSFRDLQVYLDWCCQGSR